jgi:hypothetical protein
MTHTGKARAAEAAHSTSNISLRSFCRVCRFPSFVPSCRCPVVVGAECRVRASVCPRVRPSACPSRVPSRVPRSPRTVVKDHLREKKCASLPQALLEDVENYLGRLPTQYGKRPPRSKLKLDITPRPGFSGFRFHGDPVLSLIKDRVLQYRTVEGRPCGLYYIHERGS